MSSSHPTNGHPQRLQRTAPQTVLSSPSAPFKYPAFADKNRGTVYFALAMLALLLLGALVCGIVGGRAVMPLVIIFLLATVVVTSAVVGFVLIWVGADRRRPLWWGIGLVVTFLAFAAMIGAIAWALNAQGTPGL